MSPSSHPQAAELRTDLLRELPLAELSNQPLGRRREHLEKALALRLERGPYLLPLAERENLIREVLQETVGFGPLDPLLADPSITEIMVNGPGSVFIEREGQISLVPDCRFRDQPHLRNIIDRVLAPLGRRLDDASPAVDARFPDGSRLHAILPPLALGGPVLTIRRFGARRPSLEELSTWGSLSPTAVADLREAITHRHTMLISGGAGTGKTTLLNALGRLIPPHERVIVLEDTAELRLDHPHVVYLESRPPNLEGRGEVTLRELLRHSLRMRPDRILIGEVRSAEALDLLQALNTGHQGSMATLHANSARDALNRLELLCLLAGRDSPPLSALRECIGRAVQLVAHLVREADGRRRLAQLVRVRLVDGSYALEEVYA